MGLSKHIDLIKAEKKIAWIHASIKNWYEKESKIRRLEKRLEKYGKVVTICDEMKNETGKLLPNIKNKLVRIYNPFNFDRIKNLADDYENINMSLYNQTYIISIARLTLHQKDFFTLIKGFKLVKKYGFKERVSCETLKEQQKKEKDNIIKYFELDRKPETHINYIILRKNKNIKNNIVERRKLIKNRAIKLMQKYFMDLNKNHEKNNEKTQEKEIKNNQEIKINNTIFKIKSIKENRIDKIELILK